MTDTKKTEWRPRPPPPTHAAMDRNCRPIRWNQLEAAHKSGKTSERG